jgi:hypothetical protein
MTTTPRSECQNTFPVILSLPLELCDSACCFLTASLTMTPQPLFIDDSYVTYTRKCVVFPAHGSEPHIVNKTIRTVTEEDTSQVSCYNRTVDLLGTYGSEYRKMRVRNFAPSPPIPGQYMLFYNMSPQLPLNRCVARLLDIDPNTNNVGSKLFWRGDVIAMKFEKRSENSSYITCHDADSSAIGHLGDILRDAYSEGNLERELFMDECFCKRGCWIHLAQN